MMKSTIFYLLFVILTIRVFAQSATEFDALCKQSFEESLIPIHPGIPDSIDFWNKYSKMFKHAPAFNFNNKSWLFAEPRVVYRYTAFSFTDKQEYVFTAKTPYEALTPIWDKIPDGNIYLKVEGISANGKNIDLAGSRMFYKSPVFSPPYSEAKYSYEEALLKGLDYIYNLKYIKQWYNTGQPDHEDYYLYAYPAKIEGWIINGMLMHHRYFPDNDTSLVIAIKAADYLLNTAEPAGTPLAYFPQVYEGEAIAAGKFSKEMIMMQAAVTGTTFLKLFNVTNNHKYFEAAKNIADTYAKNQLENGTWFIRINKETGEPTSDRLCIPIGIVNFISILIDEYQQVQYTKMIEPAINWIMENPVKTYDWTGQFEDYAAAAPYENLTKFEAAWFAQYLMEHKGDDAESIALAKELIAFCEDQFIFWDTTYIYDSWGTLANRWEVPCVTEQYLGYVPVDSSNDHMIFTYLKAYKYLGDPIYKEKAIALASTIVNVQDEDGKIPTFLTPTLPEFWINCMIESLEKLEEMTKIK